MRQIDLLGRMASRNVFVYSIETISCHPHVRRGEVGGRWRLESSYQRHPKRFHNGGYISYLLLLLHIIKYIFIKCLWSALFDLFSLRSTRSKRTIMPRCQKKCGKKNLSPCIVNTNISDYQRYLGLTILMDLSLFFTVIITNITTYITEWQGF